MPAPLTRVANQHIISIRFRGVTVGLIQQWTITQNRGMKPIYELNNITSGRRVDIVPGNVDALNVKVQRYDLVSQRMHQAFGFAASAIHLADHTTPFDVQELWVEPNGNSLTGTIYRGCWFSSIGRSYNATGDRVIMADASLEITDIQDI